MRYVIILAIIFLIPLASSEIFFDKQFKEIYNVGDEISFNFSISRQLPSFGYVEAYILCDNSSTLIYKRPLSLKSGQKANFTLEWPASEKGLCKIILNYDSESSESNGFKISDKINIDYEINHIIFMPAEEVIINGTANKENSIEFDGIINVFIPEILNQTYEISNGKFYIKFVIGNEAYPKKYHLYLRVFEKDAREKIINRGEILGEIEVKSSPKKLTINASDSIKPEANVSIFSSILDQAGTEILNESIVVKIFNPNREIAFQRIARSREEFFYFFSDNSSRGRWEINAYYGNLYSYKPIYVEENKKIVVKIVNDSSGSYIRILNVGNVIYDGAMELLMENLSSSMRIPINISIDKGKHIDYPLGFIGNYNLSIEGKNFSNIYLTGAAVAANIKISFKSYIISGIIIFAFFILYLVARKRLSFAKKPEIADKKIYAVFFLFSSFFPEAEELARKHGFDMNKIRDNFYYIIFYSYGAERKLINFAKEIRIKAKESGKETAVFISSQKFEKKSSSINEALLLSKIANAIDKNLAVTEGIYKSSGMPDFLFREYKTFKIGEKIIKTYTVM